MWYWKFDLFHLFETIHSCTRMGSKLVVKWNKCITFLKKMCTLMVAPSFWFCYRFSNICVPFVKLFLDFLFLLFAQNLGFTNSVWMFTEYTCHLLCISQTSVVAALNTSSFVLLENYSDGSYMAEGRGQGKHWPHHILICDTIWRAIVSAGEPDWKLNLFFVQLVSAHLVFPKLFSAADVVSKLSSSVNFSTSSFNFSKAYQCMTKVN